MFTASKFLQSLGIHRRGQIIDLQVDNLGCWFLLLIVEVETWLARDQILTCQHFLLCYFSFVTLHLKCMHSRLFLPFWKRSVLLLIVALNCLIASLRLIVISRVRLLFLLPLLKLGVYFAWSSCRSISDTFTSFRRFLQRHLWKVIRLFEGYLLWCIFRLSFHVSILCSRSIIRLRKGCIIVPICTWSVCVLALVWVIGNGLLVHVATTKNTWLLVLVHALPCIKVLALKRWIFFSFGTGFLPVDVLSH